MLLIDSFGRQIDYLSISIPTYAMTALHRSPDTPALSKLWIKQTI